MKLNIALAAGAVLLTVAATMMMDGAGPPKIQSVPAPAPAYERAGQVAPDAPLTLRDGSTAQLHDYKGRVVILNFWASWCVPCVVEYPQMLRLAAAMPDELVIVAVSVDEDSKALDRFLAKNGPRPANVIIATDPERKVTQGLFQTVQYPESYLIDSAMVLREKVVGTPPYAWDDAAMIARLKALR